MDGREVHRMEYEQCAEDARAAGERSWQVIYIFLGAIGVAVTVVAAQLDSGRPWQEHDGLTLTLTAVVAIVGSALAWAMKEISRRRAWVQRVIYGRMRAIEWLLGMRKNIYVDMLDHVPPDFGRPRWRPGSEDEEQFMRDWDALSDTDRWSVAVLHRQLRGDRPEREDLQVVTRLACVIIAAWIVLFLLELGIVIYNVAIADGAQAPWWCHGVSALCAR